MGGRRGELNRSASDIDDGAFRLRLRWETVNVGDDGVAGGSKPLDARRARRSRAKSSGLPFRSNDSGALGRVSAALGRARRFFRVPTVSPFRNFSSRLSRASVPWFDISMAFSRFNLIVSAACFRLAVASRSSAAVWLSALHFYINSQPSLFGNQKMTCLV